VCALNAGIPAVCDQDVQSIPGVFVNHMVFLSLFSDFQVR